MVEDLSAVGDDAYAGALVVALVLLVLVAVMPKDFSAVGNGARGGVRWWTWSCWWLVAAAAGVVSKEAAELMLVMVRVLLCWWTWCRCCCYWCCCWAGGLVVVVVVVVVLPLLMLMLVEGELGAGGAAASAGAGGGLSDGGAAGFEGYCGQAGHRENRERVSGRWCCAMNVVFLVHPSEFVRAPAGEWDVSVVGVATWLFLVVRDRRILGVWGE